MATPVAESTIVSVSISAEAGVQQRAAFAKPMIIDSEYTYGATARVLEVSSLAEMISAGYSTWDRAYRMAQIFFAQPDRPATVKLGQWQDGGESIAAAWAAILAADPDFYAITLTSREAADILALAAEVAAANNPYFYFAESADAGVLSNAVGNVGLGLKNLSYDAVTLLYNPGTVQVSTLVFTGTSTAGSFTGSIDGTSLNVAWNTSHAQTLTDIATAIQAVGTVATASSNGTDTITITSADALNLNALTISGNLTGATSVWTVTTSAQAPLDAGVASVISRANPGTRPIALLQVRSVTAASLTAAQRAVLLANNVSALVQYGPSTVRVIGGGSSGKVASGDLYVDTKIGIDWLTLTVQDYVFALLANAVVPYTQQGIGQVKGAVSAALTVGVQQGFIAPSGDSADGLLGTVGFAVSVPNVSAVSDANKAARILPSVTFQARGAGAIQGVEVSGTITL